MLSTAIDTAGEAILALINSMARTPTEDELVAVLAKTAMPRALSVEGRAALDRWDARVHEDLNELEACSDTGEAHKPSHEEARTIWAKPVRGMDEVIFRHASEVARLTRLKPLDVEARVIAVLN